MTIWSDWPSFRRLQSIADAPTGGAAASGALAAASFAEFIERLDQYEPSSVTSAVRDLAVSIAQSNAAFAPLVALANMVLLNLGRGHEVVVANLRAFEERVVAATGILASVGSALLPDEGLVMTHGSSGSVKAVLAAAAEAKRSLRVVCTESQPLGEGVEMAAELAGAGVAVEVVSDDRVMDEIGGMDLVIVGAHALGPGSVINTIGSSGVIKEAANVGVDALLVSSVEKALPAVLFDRASAAAGATGTMETFSLAELSLVVTEMGVLDPRAAARLAEDRLVAAELS